MDGIEDFLREPALEKLEALRKSSLLEIGEKLELETRKAMRKEKLVRIISEHMVDEQIFEAEILDRLPTESTNLTAEQIELEKYKLQTRLELEKAKMEQEIRLREIRLTEKRQEPDRKGFDLAKQVRLVPKFVESEQGTEEVECENISSDDDENSQEATEARRSPRIRKAPDQYDEWVYIAHRLDDPLTVKEALSSPEKREWMKAMESEINSLTTNKEWDLAE